MVRDDVARSELVRTLGLVLRLASRVVVTAAAPGQPTLAGELGMVCGLRRNLGEETGGRRRLQPVAESGSGFRVPWRWQDPVGPDHAMLTTLSPHLLFAELRMALWK